MRGVMYAHGRYLPATFAVYLMSVSAAHILEGEPRPSHERNQVSIEANTVGGTHPPLEHLRKEAHESIAPETSDRPADSKLIRRVRHIGSDETLASFLENSDLPRPHSKHCSLPPGARWCSAISGNKVWEMAVYNGSDFVSDTICKLGMWEFHTPRDLGLEMEALSVGATVLDIGANVGWYSFMYAAHGYNVLAVEPLTANRAIINATLCQNPDLASRIKVRAVALSDTAAPGDTCSIFSAKLNLGNGLLACGERQLAELSNPSRGDHTVEVEKVPLITLDALLASAMLKQIDVVKLDVERYECHVLHGGMQLFSLYKPRHLMIETRTDPGGVVGNTVKCTVDAVSKGGRYNIHTGAFKGPVVELREVANGGDLFFTLATEEVTTGVWPSVTRRVKGLWQAVFGSNSSSSGSGQ